MSGPIRFATAADGVRVAYTEEGTGPALLFVRGWISHIELLMQDPAYRPFFQALAGSFRVIRMDNRGNGLSDRRPENLDLDALTADVEAVVESLGLDEFILWGSCYGGPIAMTYAARHPEKVSRLILDGTYADGSRIMPPERQQDFLSIFELGRSQPPAMFAALSYMTTPVRQGSHDEHVHRGEQAIDPETAGRLYKLSFETNVTDLLPLIEAPTLVMHRRQTRAIGFGLGRSLAAMLPHAEFVSLEGRSHNLWEEEPGPALRAIGAFLEVDLQGALETTPPDLPVAIVFTDLVGSTVLTERLGDARARELMRAHDTLVRETATRLGGTEVKSTGDGFLLSFPSVTRALSCAIRLQTALMEHNRDAVEPIEIRIGINAGEPMSVDDDLHGAVVNMAARVCSMAEGGDVLVTNVVRELAAGKGFYFEDTGEVALKGFADPVRLYKLRL
jgi:class 3 adenylate cyclase